MSHENTHILLTVLLILFIPGIFISLLYFQDRNFISKDNIITGNAICVNKCLRYNIFDKPQICEKFDKFCNNRIGCNYDKFNRYCYEFYDTYYKYSDEYKQKACNNLAKKCSGEGVCVSSVCA